MSPESFDSRAKALPAKRSENGYVDENVLVQQSKHARGTEYEFATLYCGLTPRICFSAAI